MTLTPARLLRSLTTGYPLPRPTTPAADGKPAHILTEPVVVDSVEHFGRLWQTGNGRIRLVWRGKAADPMIVLRNSRDCVISDVDVLVEELCGAVVVCERTNERLSPIPSTMHGFKRWRIFGNGWALRGFWSRATVDANNEHMEYTACSLYGVGIPFEWEGQQAKENIITHCRADDAAVGIRASSSFQLIGGAFTRMPVGVELTRVGDPVRIQGTGFEACGRLLVTSGPTTAAQSIVLDSVRYEADQLAPDGEMIVMRHAGPLVMIGGRYGGGKQSIPSIALRGVGPQTVRLDGVTFGAFGAADAPVIVARNPNEARVTVDACVMQRGENDQQNTQPAAWVGIQQAVNA